MGRGWFPRSDGGAAEAAASGCRAAPGSAGEVAGVTGIIRAAMADDGELRRFKEIVSVFVRAFAITALVATVLAMVFTGAVVLIWKAEEGIELSLGRIPVGYVLACGGVLLTMLTALFRKYRRHRLRGAPVGTLRASERGGNRQVSGRETGRSP